MAERLQLHASAVSMHGKGVLITGASGSGKSGLCLQLMALGARLIVDDHVWLERRGDRLWADRPNTEHGLIEARGIGLLRADAAAGPIDLVIDMDQIETDRLPPTRYTDLLGLTLPLLHKVEMPSWPAGIAQYLLAGRSAPE